MVLPVALAPIVAGVRSEPSPLSSSGDEEAAPWPEGATTVEIARSPVDESAIAESVPSRPAGPLPSLDAMVARIPADVREALDDLFRVKFVNVQQLPASTLKS